MEIRTRSDVRIAALADVREALPMLAGWFVKEWEPYYGPDGPGDAVDELTACLNRNAVPFALVALDAEGCVLGTAALKADSLGSARAPGPWLAAFLVGAEYRRKGVGTALVAAIEDRARRLGFPEIFTSTDVADVMLQRRGWLAFDTVDSLRGAATLYRLGL